MLPPPTGQPAAEPLAFGQRVNLWRVCRAEWLKLFSLRSTWWLIAVTLVVAVAMGAFITFGQWESIQNPEIVQNAGEGPTALAATTATKAVVFTRVILAVLAVLFVTNEYSSGQIRSTLAAVPTRWPVLAAKAVIIAPVAAVVTFVGQYAAMLAAWPILAGYAKDPSRLPDGWTITDDRFTTETLKIIAGEALDVALIALFALAIAWMVRNTAGGIVVLMVALFIVPIFGTFVPVDWFQTGTTYIIGSCDNGLYNESGPFGFLKSLWVTGIWVLVSLVGAGVLLRTRDA